MRRYILIVYIAGASSDFDRATRIATSMVRDYGMSDKVGHCGNVERLEGK